MHQRGYTQGYIPVYNLVHCKIMQKQTSHDKTNAEDKFKRKEAKHRVDCSSQHGRIRLGLELQFLGPVAPISVNCTVS